MLFVSLNEFSTLNNLTFLHSIDSLLLSLLGKPWIVTGAAPSLHWTKSWTLMCFVLICEFSVSNFVIGATGCSYVHVCLCMWIVLELEPYYLFLLLITSSCTLNMCMLECAHTRTHTQTYHSVGGLKPFSMPCFNWMLYRVSRSSLTSKNELSSYIAYNWGCYMQNRMHLSRLIKTVWTY